MTALSPTGTGHCLCGGVRYEVRGPLRPIIACHCEQCARTSGNFVTATECAAEDLTLLAADSLRWFRSSEHGERGFCASCGGNLFWRRPGADSVSIFAGTLDRPTGLRIAEHIYAGSKSDYYDITDGLPARQRWHD